MNMTVVAAVILVMSCVALTEAVRSPTAADFGGNNDQAIVAAQMMYGENAVVEDRDRIKQELAKELADYVYAVLRASAGGQQQQQQSSSSMLAPMPGQTFDYSAFVDASTRQPNSPSLPESSRLYMKKSMGGGGGEGSKHIRFHQCYFNPISCFK